jgi:hypothetical protein
MPIKTMTASRYAVHKASGPAILTSVPSSIARFRHKHKTTMNREQQ